ncbi:MAG: 30S ribosomal protein S6 [Puniceicoccales bacterium]|jgi:ribosomal protein S6|nr:30S ribosomal protein S6 [Puniceicoccales bacterium]
MSDERKYTASFLLDMRGCADSVESIAGRLSETIVALGGKIEAINNLGRMDFARTTDKNFSSGTYLQILLNGKSNLASDIKAKLKLDKVINRILIETAG